MIGFALDDGTSPIELFCEDQTHHLMGKGHLGE
jgi:hypothetical protein